MLLFDADLGMANTRISAGVKPTATLADVLSGHATLRAVVMPGPTGAHVICGASGVSSPADLRAPQPETLSRELIAIAADYDAVLLRREQVATLFMLLLLRNERARLGSKPRPVPAIC